MAATTSPTTDRSASSGRASQSDAAAVADDAVATARGVMDAVAATAADVVARIPEAADGARGAFAEAGRLVERRSDRTLQLVGVASAGLAVGLLAGGAPRLLVLAALLPAAFIGASLLERSEPAARSARLQGA